MIDNQGKGPASDEGRVERNYNRPKESSPAHSDHYADEDGSKSKSSKTQKVIDSTSRKVGKNFSDR